MGRAIWALALLLAVQAVLGEEKVKKPIEKVKKQPTEKPGESLFPVLFLFWLFFFSSPRQDPNARQQTLKDGRLQLETFEFFLRTVKPDCKQTI